MKNKVILALGALLVVLVSISGIFLYSRIAIHQKPSKPVMTTDPTPFPTIAGIPTTYIGTLPCADCSGLKIELTLYRENAAQANGIYATQDTYLGTKGQTRYTKGTWKTIHGIKSDPKAIVYELIPDNSPGIRYFQVVDNKRIKMLSKQATEIQSTFNYTLIRTE